MLPYLSLPYLIVVDSWLKQFQNLRLFVCMRIECKDHETTL